MWRVRLGVIPPCARATLKKRRGGGGGGGGGLEKNIYVRNTEVAVAEEAAVDVTLKCGGGSTFAVVDQLVHRQRIKEFVGDEEGGRW